MWDVNSLNVVRSKKSDMQVPKELLSRYTYTRAIQEKLHAS